MALLDSSPSCCYYKLNVPNGVYTLGMRFGADAGVMQPGAHWCYSTCLHKGRVAAMITKNTVRFNCPVQRIPTKDNVLISLDVGVNFHIA